MSAWRRRYLPPQHGAWAMLVIPYLAALPVSGADWAHVPLLIGWLTGYLLSYYALLAVKTRKAARFGPQLGLYGAIAVPALVLTVLIRPGVLVLAPAYAVLLGVNVASAARRRERTVVNDLASVVQASLMAPVAAIAAGAALTDTAVPFAAVLLYLAGSVPYVKTMIRNRGEARYYRLSVGYHLAAVAVAVLLGWPLAVLFGWLLVRAALLPRRPLAPKQVGLIEFANSAALVLALALTG